MEYWRSYKSYLIEKYGEPVYRLALDGGFSCPNRGTGGCIYCDSFGAAAQYIRKEESSFRRGTEFVKHPGLHCSAGKPLSERIDAIRAQKERAKNFVTERYGAGKYSIYLQANTNTFDSPENLRAIYDAALEGGPWCEFIISTRPDCISEEIICLIASFKDSVEEIWVELGLQTSNDETLRRINRGHDAASFSRACTALHAAGFKVSAHVILGLPGENQDDFAATAAFLNSEKVEAVKIHNLHVLADTPLFEEWEKGDVHVPDFGEHLSNTRFFLERLNPEIIVQRLIAESPSRRLAAPRDFPDKRDFTAALTKSFEASGTKQGSFFCG